LSAAGVAEHTRTGFPAQRYVPSAIFCIFIRTKIDDACRDAIYRVSRFIASPKTTWPDDIPESMIYRVSKNNLAG